MTETIVIHTDGACAGNPGPGGFAAVIEHPQHGELVITGGDPKTTNNRMELSAVIEGMKAVNFDAKSKDQPITVRSDSKYITDAFNQKWVDGWKSKGWRNANKQPVMNQDLWLELLNETGTRAIKWLWVKGHSGDAMNERCDRLAKQQAEIAPGEKGYWAAIGKPPLSEKPKSSQNGSTAPEPASSSKYAKKALLEAISALESNQEASAIHCIEKALAFLNQTPENTK